jgi:CRISPR-associated endonuclease/helicase Cas3
MDPLGAYRDLFARATRQEPYTYQERLATGPLLPAVLHAPTGSGKTRAVLLAWLYRRLHAPAETRSVTPLRLVYALPMRVLVEQVWNVVTDALGRLNIGPEEVQRQLVMGGHVGGDWVRHPERPAVLVGTIDMLLSRALNRGYAAGRARWPMDFGLLNADCLWVLDETQLMEVATVTTAQLEGLRRKLGTWRPCQTIWMSATVDTRALQTVDHHDPGDVFELLPVEVTGELRKRLTARKVLERRDGDAAGIALAEHLPDSVTLIVHNTVKAAAETHRRLRKRPPAGEPELLLLHSRFRPPDRQWLVKRLGAEVPPGGRVICATQVVEAGVDISARLLVTEVAPWSSIVQRLGRCNRYGELDAGLVRWLDVQRPDPYGAGDVDDARAVLGSLEGVDVSPQALAEVMVPERPREAVQVLRRRDLLDLFDTAPDLSGNDLDVSRFIRDADEIDCRVFWRRWEGEEPGRETGAPGADELCPVPVGELRKFVGDGRSAWVWDSLDARWRHAQGRDLRPGMVVLLPAAAGGYSSETGWDPAWKGEVGPVSEASDELDANRADPLTNIGNWVDLETHTRDVVAHASSTWHGALDGVAPAQAAQALELAATAHDWGKALERFQEALLESLEDAEKEGRRGTVWAKSACWVRPKERNPRHELASALALLQSDWLGGRPLDPWADLVLFLVAAHHGKARVTIRPWPQDEPPTRVLGVTHGDELPQVRLDGLTLPATRLRLDPLQMGDGAEGASWAARMLALRDHPELGPFRMAHLEAILRAADWRASEDEEKRG